ncbi:MAG: MopE-related protein [Bradymonadia bacterium]
MKLKRFSLNTAIGLSGLWLSSCSLLIDVEGCRSDDQCPAGQRCVAEACVPGPQLPDARVDADLAPDAGEDAGGPDLDLADAAVDAALPDASTDCIDEDGDDFGRNCPAGPDCDDTNADRFPGAEEQCDGADDDCDGRIDEGALTGCYAGPEGTAGVGLCVEGLSDCGGGLCLEQVTPATASTPDAPPCDGFDGDCDGNVDEADEGCMCAGDESQACYGGPAGTVGVGRCLAGTQTCSGGAFGDCEGDIVPEAERCNGFDDDCDALTDEGVTNRCGTCGPVPQELCNGEDDDCDGRIDEGVEGTGQPCESGLGQCARSGETICDPARGLVVCNSLTEEPVEEICNGLDDDCDGNTDEALTAPQCERVDGLCWAAVARCGGAEGWLVCTLEDYRLTAPAFVDAETGAECTGLDDDCDGLTDEACPCEAGASCGVEGGACTQGTITCGPDGPVCQGATTPTAELCNNIDDDCDGSVDEAIEIPCGPEVVACQGIQRCIGGELTGCIGVVEPAEEQCNNADDDCDGRIDEGVSQACGGTVGACVAGQALCREGVFGACVGQIPPALEACDGVDNDCDGLVDERLARPCGQDEGRCQRGLQTCTDARWGACEGATGPTEETCDNTDEDCDGLVDEAVARACEIEGLCGTGVELCVAGAWGECAAEGPDGSAELCDGLDNDCDDATDEALTRPCGIDVGRCTLGVETCAGGAWGACADAVGPSEEDCNNFDDDCDGRVDEDLTRPCYDGPGGTEDVGRCIGGLQRCDAGRWGSCDGAVRPSDELCNGEDDDCDGEADEAACDMP